MKQPYIEKDSVWRNVHDSWDVRIKKVHKTRVIACHLDDDGFDMGDDFLINKKRLVKYFYHRQ